MPAPASAKMQAYAPDMIFPEARIQSFSASSSSKSRKQTTPAWPHPTASSSRFPTPSSLAAFGFYFSPSSTEPDRVVSYIDGTILADFQAGETIEQKLHDVQPDNAWLLINQSKSAGQPSEKGDGIFEYSDEDLLPDGHSMTAARRRTFADRWPHDDKRGWKPTAQKLAQAGFHFEPTEEDTDNASCIYCGRTLSGWEKTDDAVHEHLRKKPECAFFNCSFVERNGHDGPRNASRSVSATSKKATQNKTRKGRELLQSSDSEEEDAKDVADGRLDSDADEGGAAGGRGARSRAASNRKTTAKEKRSASQTVKNRSEGDPESEDNAEDNARGPTASSSHQTVSQQSNPRRRGKAAVEQATDATDDGQADTPAGATQSAISDAPIKSSSSKSLRSAGKKTATGSETKAKTARQASRAKANSPQLEEPVATDDKNGAGGDHDDDDTPIEMPKRRGPGRPKKAAARSRAATRSQAISSGKNGAAASDAAASAAESEGDANATEVGASEAEKESETESVRSQRSTRSTRQAARSTATNRTTSRQASVRQTAKPAPRSRQTRAAAAAAAQSESESEEPHAESVADATVLVRPEDEGHQPRDAGGVADEHEQADMTAKAAERPQEASSQRKTRTRAASKSHTKAEKAESVADNEGAEPQEQEEPAGKPNQRKTRGKAPSKDVETLQSKALRTSMNTDAADSDEHKVDEDAVAESALVSPTQADEQARIPAAPKSRVASTRSASGASTASSTRKASGSKARGGRKKALAVEDDDDDDNKNQVEDVQQKAATEKDTTPKVDVVSETNGANEIQDGQQSVQAAAEVHHAREAADDVTISEPEPQPVTVAAKESSTVGKGRPESATALGEGASADAQKRVFSPLPSKARAPSGRQASSSANRAVSTSKSKKASVMTPSAEASASAQQQQHGEGDGDKENRAHSREATTFSTPPERQPYEQPTAIQAPAAPITLPPPSPVKPSALNRPCLPPLSSLPEPSSSSTLTVQGYLELQIQQALDEVKRQGDEKVQNLEHRFADARREMESVLRGQGRGAQGAVQAGSAQS
ncbi:unnamed protein product [Jaminaea pallidilutea]